MHRETVAAIVAILSVFVQSEAFPGFVDSLQVRNNPDVIIKNKKTGLVLGISGNYVVVQQFDGSQAQIWRQEPYNEKWVFINKANELFLAIDGYQQPRAGTFLVTKPLSDRPSQHWLINPNGTIVSSANEVLAIDMPQYQPGARTIVSIVNEDCGNQIFDLVIQ